MNNENKSNISKWLELLQQESWQLELIISGFAIFLVGSLYESLNTWGSQISVLAAGDSNASLIMIPFIFIYGAWFFLLINLIFHVIFRGLWISTIGLRYVSKDIDWDSMRLHPKFEEYLQRKVGRYDDYIERLEKFCSIIFAFTFLIVFVLISFCLYFIALISIVFLFSVDFLAILPNIIKSIVIICFLIGGLFYFFDFLTLGWLKRKKWMAILYFPIYRFFSLITFSWLYRPIYYNMIDNRFGRNFAKLLIPYIVIGVFLSSIGYGTHPYFPKNFLKKDLNILNDRNYDNLRDSQNYIEYASLSTKFVSNGFLELFILYKNRKSEEVLLKICPDLQPLSEKGWFSNLFTNFSAGFKAGKKDKNDDRDIQKDSTLVISIGTPLKNTPSDSSLFCLGQLYEIAIDDSIMREVDYAFFKYDKYDEKGLKTIIDIDYLGRGKHYVSIQQQQIEKDSLFWKNMIVIPFWKE
ncbi:MAG: hypothetical protein ACPG49_03235 [Chitinophagales bacterium]